MKFLLAFVFLMSAFVQSKQGLEGFLREAKGNQMGIQNRSSKKGQPLKSTLYVFKKLGTADLFELEGQWCKSIKQKPYAIIQTDLKGYFKTRLRPGKYVVVVSVYDGYFIPSFNQYNEPSSIIVKQGQWEQLEILVNSKAIY